MTSEVRRNPETDRLLTADNSVFLLIDYQPLQVSGVNSMNRAELIQRTEATINLIKSFGIPIITSTVNVENGRNKDLVPGIKTLLKDIPSFDRTSINAWEDTEFKQAVKETGRKKLIIGALWTEACLTFPTLDALAEGFEVYPVVDIVGGTSKLAHETALRRVEQAGAQLTTFAQLALELQRDWSHTETVDEFVHSMYEGGLFLELE